MASENSGGIQYALTALGVGMLALGILMMVWSVVPGFGKDHETQGGNSSSPNAEESKHKVSQVSYILCAGGVFLLLLSICLSVREKKRRRTQEEVVNVQSESSILPERGVDDNNRLAVPSYDEVMQGDGVLPQEGSGTNQAEQNMASLPSYESLVEVGLPSSSNEVSNAGAIVEQPSDERATSRLGRRFSSKKIRRILSDKSHLKRFRLNLSNTNNAVVNLEPLTPPPQYEEGMEKNFENIKPS
ncbi:transmembrane protein 51a [Pristis pectinata]|uniref:transmembrane protein 51a n=1 Tax=Pristis pectinata TaxID=685728 RepID=UPI00223DD982|nr:transmembrane protein 51a [Pristis pectinata]